MSEEIDVIYLGHSYLEELSVAFFERLSKKGQRRFEKHRKAEYDMIQATKAKMAKELLERRITMAEELFERDIPKT